jgi:hypothetical protein
MRRILLTLASLPLILMVGLILRLAYAWDYQHPRPRQALSAIPFLLEPGNIAASLAHGKGFSDPFRANTGPTAWTTPVYPLLIAGVFRIFGIYTFASYVAAILLNIAFSTATCVPVFYAGKRIGGLGTAAIAAWLWAVFPNAILFTVSIWDVSLSALLVATIVWASLALAGSTSPRDWVGYGLLWGFTLMTNATLGSVLPFLLCWLAYRTRRLAYTALALGVILLCCVPWTIRNYAVFHEFVPLRSVMGLQLWMGNNEQTRGGWAGALHPIDNAADREKYVQLGEIAYMEAKSKEAIHFMLADPWREARLIRNRFVTFWAGGAVNPVREFLSSRSLYYRGTLLFNVLAGIGALCGIVALCRRHNWLVFPAAMIVIVYPLAAYLTLASARYRLPIDPAVLLLAAVAMKKGDPEVRRSPDDIFY